MVTCSTNTSATMDGHGLELAGNGLLLDDGCVAVERLLRDNKRAAVQSRAMEYMEGMLKTMQGAGEEHSLYQYLTCTTMRNIKRILFKGERSKNTNKRLKTSFGIHQCP